MKGNPGAGGETGTGSAAYFEHGVTTIIERLTGDDSSSASEMLAEARKLEGTFHAWAQNRPSNDEREAVLRALFRLSQRAEAYLRAGSREG